ncbi:MAG: hypothetical protein ABJM57_16570, partial [Lentilitoribacter sp.]
MQLRRTFLSVVRKTVSPLISAGLLKRPTPLNLRFRIVQSNHLIRQNDCTAALDVIWELGQNNLGYPGVGAQLHKIALYANKQKNTDVLARISQTILPAFKSSALTSVPFHVNKAYVSF